MVLIRLLGGHFCTRLDNSSFLHVTDLTTSDHINNRNQHSNNNSMKKKKKKLKWLPFTSFPYHPFNIENDGEKTKTGQQAGGVGGETKGYEKVT